MLLRQQSHSSRKALSVQVSHRFTPDSVAFDDDNLVSHAGLVPVLTLAERTGLHQLLADKVSLRSTSVASAGANVAPKLTTIVAGMCAGADSIDDIDVLRAGGHRTLFTGVYAPATLGQTLRELTFGHARQLDSVLTNHLRALAERVDLLPGAAERTFIDIDSLLRPVYGTPNKAPPTVTPRSPPNKSSAKASHHWQHRSAPTTPRR